MTAADNIDIDALAGETGFEPLPGVRKEGRRTFVNEVEHLVLKLAGPADPADFFTGYVKAVRDLGLGEVVPMIIDYGFGIAGIDRPFLVQKYVVGVSAAQLMPVDMDACVAVVADQLPPVLGQLASLPATTITNDWDQHLRRQSKLSESDHFDGISHLYGGVRDAGMLLRDRHPCGHPIHGDLQLSNVVVDISEGRGSLGLIDWDPQAMCLPYEVCTLYCFLRDPNAIQEVAPDLERWYAAKGPLLEMWLALAGPLSRLDVTSADLIACVTFRMGRALLHHATEAMRRGHAALARRYVADVEQMLDGAYFELLPLDLLR